MNDLEELGRAARGYVPNLTRGMGLSRVDASDAFRFGFWFGLGLFFANLLCGFVLGFVLALFGIFPFGRP